MRAAHVKRNDTDDLTVRLAFYASTRQRRDVDNLTKTVLDACNGIAWRDDAQVVRLVVDLVRGDPRPRTELAVYVHTRRGRDCPRCGTTLAPSQVALGGVYCSKTCYDTAQRKGTYRACAGCGQAVYRQVGKAAARTVYCTPACREAKRGACRRCAARLPFPPSSRNRFCSTACSDAWHRERRVLNPVGNCTDCGVPCSRTADRCRACHLASRRSA